MKHAKHLLVACAAALSLAACGDTATPEQAGGGAAARPTATVKQAADVGAATPDALAQARADYGNFCVRCHKQDGAGGPFELEDGTTLKVPSLREHGRTDSDKELAGQIRNGGDGMPAFKNRLDEARITDLVKFVRAEFHGRVSGAASTPAPAPAR